MFKGDVGSLRNLKCPEIKPRPKIKAFHMELNILIKIIIIINIMHTR